MKTLTDWLGEYGENHRNHANETIHWICVPLIMLALVALFAAIPRPAAFAVSPWVHWGTVLIVLALIYYFALSPRLALGITVVGAALIFATWGLAQLPWSPAISGAVIFVAAWTGQFTGHRIEGKRPSFFTDLQFLVIGPLWLLSRIYKRLGWRIV